KTAVSEEPHKGVIRGRSETLSGPKVVGKIQLPVERKPVASSSGPSHSNDNKRKRKRSNKNTPVNPNAVAGQKGTNEGNANRSGGGFNKGGGQQAGGYKQGQGSQQHPHGKGRHDHRAKGRHQETPKEEPSEKEIQDQIKATLARLSGAGKSGKFAQRAKLRRQKRDDIALSAEEAAMEEAAQSKILRVTEFVTANELAN